MSFFGRVFGGSHSSASASAAASNVMPAAPAPAPPAPAPQQPHFIQPQQQLQFPPAPPPIAARPSVHAYIAANQGHQAAPAMPGPVGPLASWELLGAEAMSPLNPFRPDSSAVSAQPSARTYFTMVEHDGSAYVFGGFGDAKGRYNDLRAYNVELDSWTSIQYHGEPPPPLYLHSAVVYDDQMWIFGGSIGKDSNDLYSYNFRTRAWKHVRPNAAQPLVPCARYGHAACVVGDQMLIAGGCKQNNVYFMDAYVYHFPSNVWRRIADIPIDIAYHSLVCYQNRVLLLGGFNGIKFNPHVYSYTIAELRAFMAPPQWVQTPCTARPTSSLSSAGTRQPPPFCGAAVVVGQDSCFVFAGYTSTGHANDLYKLDLCTMEWSVVDVANSARPVPRAYLQACISRTGYLFVLGGYDGRECVRDFRRIRVIQQHVDILAMLRDSASIKAATSYAMKNFAKVQTLNAASFVRPTLEEPQLEALLQNLKHHLQISVPANKSQSSQPSPAGVASSSSSSSAVPAAASQLSSGSAAFYPFDTSRLSDLCEFGFTREMCLECLEQMYNRGQDTKNFSLVVEHLLAFSSDVPPPPPADQSVSASASALDSHSRSSSVSRNQNEDPISVSAQSPSASSLPMAPSANADSLQEQVHRLQEEVKDIKTCKVCFEEQIDSVLVPCGHLVVCSGCAASLKQHGHECPSGRCHVESYLKVFWS